MTKTPHTPHTPHPPHPSSRLARAIQAARADGPAAAGPAAAALGIFITAGFPSRAHTVPVMHAIERGGADFIELGMPFSDPLAEGLPIQRSSKRALEDGMTMRRTLDMAAAFRAESELPLLLMGYANPVLKFGLGNFFDACRSSGVDGVILPDVPPEEATAFRHAAQHAGVDMVFLVSPTTSDGRMKEIDALSSGFVYAVSVNGITGSALHDTDAIGTYLKRAKSNIVQNPLLVGFGIRTHEDVQHLTQHADGAIVGSALVSLIESWWDDHAQASLDTRLDAVTQFIDHLKTGTPPAS